MSLIAALAARNRSGRWRTSGWLFAAMRTRWRQRVTIAFRASEWTPALAVVTPSMNSPGRNGGGGGGDGVWRKMGNVKQG